MHGCKGNHALNSCICLANRITLIRCKTNLVTLASTSCRADSIEDSKHQAAHDATIISFKYSAPKSGL